MPTPRAGGLAVQADIGGPLFPRMLIFGGDSGLGATNDVYALRLTDPIWEPVCSLPPCANDLPTPRAGAAGSCNAVIRAPLVSGEMSPIPDETLYKFDPTAETWTSSVPPTRPQGRGRASFTWLPDDEVPSGLHYLIGGTIDGTVGGASNDV